MVWAETIALLPSHVAIVPARKARERRRVRERGRCVEVMSLLIVGVMDGNEQRGKIVASVERRNGMMTARSPHEDGKSRKLYGKHLA